MNGTYFWPMFGQVALTFVTWVVMYRRRLREMRVNRIDPQRVARSHDRSELLRDTRASDNFTNLFEVPMLFFAACIVAGLSVTESMLLPLLAWCFVALRVVHSMIQVTYNRVVHRFLVYVLSTLVVFGMWVTLAGDFLLGPA